jgi:hypothetical protein
MKSIGLFRYLFQKKQPTITCGLNHVTTYINSHLIIERMKMFNNAILRQKKQMFHIFRLS